MKSIAGTAADPMTVTRGRIAAMAVALAALSVTLLAASQGVAQSATRATGFAQPYAGTPRYERYAPTQAANGLQVDRPLGWKAAARIARELGLNKRDAFTAKQYKLFVSGRGVGGEPTPAKLVDASVRILTNTTGNPTYATVNGKVTPIVLGSYGLMVNAAGMLESPANTDAPTRRVNGVIEPGGYMPRWCRQNRARASLRMLYRSAYTSEAVFGNKSQLQSEVAQLVPNQKGAGELDCGNVDGALDMDRQLCAHLHAEPEPGSEDARPVDADPRQRGAGNCGKPGRPGFVQPVPVVVSQMIAGHDLVDAHKRSGGGHRGIAGQRPPRLKQPIGELRRPPFPHTRSRDAVPA